MSSTFHRALELRCLQALAAADRALQRRWLQALIFTSVLALAWLLLGGTAHAIVPA